MRRGLDSKIASRLRLGLAALALSGGLTAGAGVAQAPALAGLGGLERGNWELRVREPGGAVSHLCLGDPRLLLQVQHARSSCQRFVVTDAAQHIVVTYDCAAAGNGRTDLRIETPRLVQIQSQGIAEGAPFSFEMEARRVGVCGGAH
ncbi:hypothetical protein PX699_01320 [Sphingobium sp. H39-3-25]|uniref:DUF3617 domain-containing protein n=1 Tax=Sphingobium arseniciresistens TaxID=3030834 RepID=UPI0023B9C952|nr:hypothetical protein [Sphingobium arseniciresistens]